MSSGLLVQYIANNIEALILAHERSGVYGNLLEMAKGVIFMGTPHRGANVASWAKFAAQALRALQMGTATNKSLLSDLRKNSKTLAQISQQFVERGSTLRIKTFYEGNKMDYMNCLVFFSLDNRPLEYEFNSVSFRSWIETQRFWVYLQSHHLFRYPQTIGVCASLPLKMSKSISPCGRRWKISWSSLRARNLEVRRQQPSRV